MFRALAEASALSPSQSRLVLGRLLETELIFRVAWWLGRSGLTTRVAKLDLGTAVRHVRSAREAIQLIPKIFARLLHQKLRRCLLRV